MIGASSPILLTLSNIRTNSLPAKLDSGFSPWHKVKSFIRTTHINGISSNELFAWHIREGAFERLNPPWQQFKVIERKGNIQSNGTVKIKMKIAGPIHTTWLVKHSDYVEGRQFRDNQIKGLFSSWTHTHLFNSLELSSCILDDHI
jgi:ligand-binding SRPBCC domain-containing protein